MLILGCTLVHSNARSQCNPLIPLDLEIERILRILRRMDNKGIHETLEQATGYFREDQRQEVP